jgi:PEP-CTERM motif
MKRIRSAVMVLVIALLFAQRSQAAIIFTLTPANAEIIQGASAVFNVDISSATQEVIGGYTINVRAGAGNGTGGTFTSGTFNFLIGAPSQAWDVATTPGQAFSTADTAASGGTGLGAVLPANTITRLGTLTLSTVGVAPGNYAMSMTSLNAIQLNGLPIQGSASGTINSGNINYMVVSAVPEPSSLLFVTIGVIGAIGIARKRGRFFRSKVPQK